MILGQSVATLQYIRIAVKATVGGNAAYNPTGDVVSFGFLNQATNQPSTVPGSFYSGSWEVDYIGGQTTYVARCLVGPGGTFVPTALTNYWVTVKIVDNPEIPLLFVGELRIT